MDGYYLMSGENEFHYLDKKGKEQIYKNTFGHGVRFKIAEYIISRIDNNKYHKFLYCRNKKFGHYIFGDEKIIVNVRCNGLFDEEADKEVLCYNGNSMMYFLNEIYNDTKLYPCKILGAKCKENGIIIDGIDEEAELLADKYKVHYALFGEKAKCMKVAIPSSDTVRVKFHWLEFIMQTNTIMCFEDKNGTKYLNSADYRIDYEVDGKKEHTMCQTDYGDTLESIKDYVRSSEEKNKEIKILAVRFDDRYFYKAKMPLTKEEKIIKKKTVGKFEKEFKALIKSLENEEEKIRQENFNNDDDCFPNLMNEKFERVFLDREFEDENIMKL